MSGWLSPSAQPQSKLFTGQVANPYYTGMENPNGMNAGMIQGIASGIGLLGNMAGASQQNLNIPRMAPEQYQLGTRPTYTAGQQQNAAFYAKPQGPTAGEVVGDTAQGAIAGAQIGGPVGAAIGAGVGLVGGVLSGLGRRRRQRDQRQQALDQVAAAQSKYNADDQTYRAQANQMEDYYQRQNRGEYNVYRSRY